MEKADDNVVVIYQDIIDRIIEESSSDFNSLASLCRVSRASVHIARRHLYKELDLTFSPGPKLRKQTRAVLNNDQLWSYVKSLSIEVMISYTSNAYGTDDFFSFDWTRLAAQVSSTIKHVHLRTWVTRFKRSNRAFSDKRNPVRSQVQTMLGGPSLESVALVVEFTPDLPSFPDWILKSIPLTVTKVNITSCGRFRLKNSVPLGESSQETPGNSKRTEIGQETRPRRDLEEFSLDLPDPQDLISNWVTLLAAPCFNVSLKRTKKLTISHQPGDESPWRLPDEASRSLEELTIIYHSGLDISVKPHRLAEYRALHTISFSIDFLPQPFLSRWVTSRTFRVLVTFFNQALPSSLRQISIQLNLNLNHRLIGRYDLPGIPTLALTSWKELDETLSRHLSLNSVIIDLRWPYHVERLAALAPSTHGHDSEEAKRRTWKERLYWFTGWWKTQFASVDERGILDVEVTRTRICQ